MSINKNAVYILENNLDKVNLWRLSENDNAIHILENNLDKVDWYMFSCEQITALNMDFLTCLEAVKQDGALLKYVHYKHYKRICLAAIDNDSFVLQYIRYEMLNEHMCLVTTLV